MRVMSWNMYCYNRQNDAVVALVRDSGADIFFLQEVPAKLRDTLCGLYPHSHNTVDSERVYGGAELTNYNLILSRYPLSDTRTIPFDPLPLKLRTKLAIFLMWPLGWARTWNRNAAAARAQTPLGDIAVVSAHLTLSSPTLRAQEFKKIMNEIDEPVIVGGDFNVIEFPPLKILSWVLGAHIHEALPWFNERALWDQRFKNEGLVNRLRGTVTHAFSQSQLDHIVVSRSIPVVEQGRLSTLAGSDHAPIFLELGPHP